MPRFFSTLIFVALAVGLPCARAADTATEASWSADLLQQILKSDVAPAKPAGVGEMLLRTYHFNRLRVAEAGRSQNVLTILQKLLPPGSTLTTDVPANSIHVLTTKAAHDAVFDYLSAVDVNDAPAAPAVVPEEVKQALARLGQAGEQSSRVIAAVNSLQSGVARDLASIEARQRREIVKVAAVGAGFAAVLALALFLMLRRRPATNEAALAAPLQPDQLALALSPVHERMRNDMLGLLNEVAIKLQAQHNEQQKSAREQQLQFEGAREALAAERRQFIAETGSMVVQAVQRVDATTTKLAKQQDKVSELVQELQATVRELDETKDNLRHRQVELEHERAKIAALSLLLEEGPTAIAPVDPTPTNGHSAATSGSGTPNGRIPTLSTCNLKTAPTPATPPRFTFVPPDHPES